jgi:hypothetical protein
MSNDRSGNGGHSPGHVRDTFLSAIDAYLAWEQGEPEPIVDFEVRDEARPITISQVCEMVWNCADCLPSDALDTLDRCGLELNRRTYAAAARTLLPAIKNQLAVQSTGERWAGASAVASANSASARLSDHVCVTVASDATL